MRLQPSTQTVVSSTLNTCISKVDKFIEKRESLLAKMDAYSAQKFINIISQINQQQINCHQILEPNQFNEIQEHQSQKLDCLISMAFTQQQQLIKDIKSNRSASIYSIADSTVRKLKMRIGNVFKIDSYDEDLKLTQKKTVYQNKTKDVIPIQQKGIQEGNSLAERYRLIKHQQEQEAKKLAAFLEQKKAFDALDYTGNKFTYDYESKMVLSNFLQRKTQSVNKMRVYVDQATNKKVKKLNEAQQNKIYAITERKNITQTQISSQIIQEEKRNRRLKLLGKKQQQQQLEGQGKYEVKLTKNLVENTLNYIIVGNAGVRLTLNNQIFQKKVNKTKQLERFINRRLSQIEYRKFKFQEQKRRGSLRVKIQHQQENSVSSFHSEDKQTQRKLHKALSINSYRNEYNKSKIVINNHSLCLDMSRANYSTTFTYSFEQLQIGKKALQEGFDKKIPLSTVDQYNLRYLKFSGNPPKVTQNDNTLDEIKKASKNLQNQKIRTEGRKGILYAASRKKQKFRAITN